MAKKEEFTPEELEQQADALLAANPEDAESVKTDEEPAVKPSKKTAKKKGAASSQAKRFPSHDCIQPSKG